MIATLGTAYVRGLQAIRQALLPHLFERIGLDDAKEVIERVIQITRVGLSRGELRP